MVDLAKAFADARGSVAIVVAIAATALVITVGVAVDYGTMVAKRSDLQAAADAGSIAAARELTLANTLDSQVRSVARQMVAAQLAGSTDSGDLSISVSIDRQNTEVTVDITEKWIPYFSHFLGASFSEMSASALAQIIGSGKVCVIGLEPSETRTISLKREATLTAPSCGVISNSTSSTGIYTASTSATITAGLICTAGGFGGPTGSYEPKPVNDCPPTEDPLSDRIPPNVGACDHTNLIVEESATLYPGTYCGGVDIAGDIAVRLESGVYIMSGGPLAVGGKARLMGENVGFYLTGSNALINLGPNTSISLTAPKEDNLAGLLFFEDRNVATGEMHRISSNDARLLLGTIYLSRNTLSVDANAPVADESAYTAIIARKLLLDAGPNLVLNSNYSATDIPISNALSGVGGRIVLAR